MLFCVCVEVFVTFVLLLKNARQSAAVINFGVWPVVRLEGLCHVINGGTDHSFSQGVDISFRKCCFSHCLGECAYEEGADPWFEGGEIWVVVDVDVREETCPSPPSSSTLVLCCTCRALLTGSFASKHESQQSILDGSGLISKLGGSCCDACLQRICVSFELDRWVSRDKASDTTLSMPGNHWE